MQSGGVRLERAPPCRFPLTSMIGGTMPHISELPAIRAWAAPLLRCPECSSFERLEPDQGSLRCPSCARMWPISDGVASFLDEAHPAVLAERRAVGRLDRGEDELEVAPAIRRRLETQGAEGDAKPSDDLIQMREAAFRAHVAESRRQLSEVLEEHPLERGEVLVELGADNCWASPHFLDRGCRVIAVDITDHLYAAPRAQDPDLVRLQADMNRLPLLDGVADVVWATAAAHHSWDLGHTLREAARVLRPGGRLFLCCEPMPSWLRWPFGLGVGKDERALGIHETWIPRRRWLAHARRAGFEAELVFPRLDDAALEARLEGRRIPRQATSFVRPLLRLLQVSIHLVAVKIDTRPTDR